MKYLILFGLLAAALFYVWSNFARAADAIKVNQAAPAFSLIDQNGKTRALADYRGKWLVLYFYPKDDTPGCTQEACAFRDDFHQITTLGGVVLGISIDDTQSHLAFAKKYHLPFPLLSDPQGLVAAKYGALSDLGFIKIAKRHTFIIDPHGGIAKVYLKVTPARHAQEIIADLKALSNRP